MAHSTTLNVNQINTQAQRHDDTATEIGRQLDQLKVQVDATLQASWSGATQALQTTCDNWVESVRKSVLSHLTNMATNIRNEANNQEGTDQEAKDIINNLSMGVETSSFLGATNV
jgi:uncharacterized protein YukE